MSSLYVQLVCPASSSVWNNTNLSDLWTHVHVFQTSSPQFTMVIFSVGFPDFVPNFCKVKFYVTLYIMTHYMYITFSKTNIILITTKVCPSIWSVTDYGIFEQFKGYLEGLGQCDWLSKSAYILRPKIWANLIFMFDLKSTHCLNNAHCHGWCIKTTKNVRFFFLEGVKGVGIDSRF